MTSERLGPGLLCLLLAVPACGVTPSSSEEAPASAGSEEGGPEPAATPPTSPPPAVSDRPAPPLGDILGIAWSPEGRTIAVIDLPLSARAWDAATGSLIGSLAPGEQRGVAPVAVSFDASGEHVLAGATRWRPRDGQRTALAIGGRSQEIGGAGAQLTRDWRVSVEEVGDDLVIADAESGAELRRLRGLAGDGAELAVSTATGAIVVCGARELAIADALGNTRGRVAAPRNGGWARFSCSLSPQGDYAAAGTDAGGFVLVDTTRAVIAGELGSPAPEDANRFTRFSADGRRVLVLQDYVVRTTPVLHVDIYEVPSRRRISSFDVGHVFPAGLAFTADASRVVAAGFEGAVNVFDATRGVRIATIDPGLPGQRVAAFDPAGQRVVIATGRTVAIYDVATGQRTATWNAE